MGIQVLPPIGPPLPPPGPGPALPAWVLLGPTPGVVCALGFGGRFVADFDRSQVIDGTVAETNVRVLRPGVIVLPNLDIDDVSRLPTPLPADLTAVLDASDATPNGPDDITCMTALQIRHPDPCAVTASAITMKVHADDANRIRIFAAGGTDPVIGAGKPSGPAEEHEILAVPTVDFDFVIEATTLPGDPTHGVPSDPAPNTPEGYPVTLPTGITAGSSLAATRAPADVWIELDHTVASPFRSVRDVALITIAPWIMTDNTLPAERLYAVYFPPATNGARSNHDFVYDLAEAAAAAFGGGVTLPADTSTDLAVHGHGSPENLFLVDGDTFPDQWIQDELEFGYCWAPHAWTHVVAHLKRNRGLTPWIKRDLAEQGIGVYEGLDPTNVLDSTDYGGNLEVSPAVPRSTPAIAKDGGGPSVPAHPPAPLGKIIVGDSDPRPVHSDYHAFLLAQKVQPVLAIDTSWLMVGHVDEFSSFVRSRNARGFKLVMASVFAMDKLLEALIALPVSSGRGHFHVGRFENGTYAEESAEDMKASLAAFNKKLREDKLGPIQRRLERGLDLRASDIIRLPTYFKQPADARQPFGHPRNQTVAHNVGSVNMQVVNGHLMVPRPFGPRLPTADAQRLVRNLLDTLGLRSTAVRPGPTGGFMFWAAPGTTLDQLGAFFMRAADAAERDDVIANLRGTGALSAATSAKVAAMRANIESFPANTLGSNPLSAVTSSTGTFTKWKRVFVPSDTLDVVEVYMRSVLETEGNVVHFIDDWNVYHTQLGEVHCGTNVRRTPHPLAGRPAWWDHYNPNPDLGYDPAS